ncbi:MAG TPA: PAS domain S-box protein [Opitutaceae bacterium]|nr:PAS domain S-box protein [Opitutaceae bacterium]
MITPPSRPREPAPFASADENRELAARRERNRQLQFLSDHFPDGVVYQYTVTAEGRRMLTYLGRGAERIFGERPPEMPTDVAWLTARIVAEDEPAMADDGERSRLELTPFNHDVRIHAADGVERWVSFRTQPRELSDGSIVWDGVVLDVTDQRGAEESVRRRAAFLAALNQTTLELLGRRNVGELLQALADRAATLLHSPHAEISLLEGDELVVRAFSKGRDYLAGDRVRRGEAALSWRAIDTCAPAVVAHYAEQPDSRAVYRAHGIHAAAVFPILRGGNCVGVLGLARETPGAPFANDDVQEGVLLAQMAALVLHNASIHEDAVRDAEARTLALRESEERFRGVFDKSPIVIALLSVPEGRIVEINPAAEAAFGFTRGEAIGRTSVALNLWVDLALRERYLEKLRTERAVSGFEAEMRRKNGEVFTVLYSGSLVTIAGQPYSLNLLQDISARKQSEAARDHSLALMRATLESTADGILVVNGDGRIETYNRNFAEMWRLDEADVRNAGLPVRDDPHPSGSKNPWHVPGEERLLRTILDQLVEPERFLVSVRDLYSGSEDEVFDELHCKDGRVFERYSRPQLMSGRPVGRVWSFRDITDRREAEAALRSSEERFRVLADVSPVGIFRTDPDGSTTFVNRRWCELSGLAFEEALGNGWMKALHPEDRDRVAANWAEAVRAGESSAAEYRFVRLDGSIAWLVGQSRAHFDAAGRLAGYVGTITDVTNLKRAEEERKKIEAQLRQSRKMESLGTLAGGIAHDFNNILNGTFGFLDLARLELPPGHPAHEWLDRIAASSQRARELVRQILTFSRKTEGERVPQRLHAVVSEALRLLRSTLPTMVELDSRISVDAPPVLADATQIHQVVLNLCTNAWHALPERGGRIVVTLEPWTITSAQASAQPELLPGPSVRLSVSDNGSGMDAATLDHIFEPFFTTKDTGAGTGLGLAVVHGIVKAHGGGIVVRSTVGSGSSFELYFPAAPVAVEPPKPAAPPETPRGKGERVLVVDDDAVSGFAIEKLVESLGYVVTRCTRPEEALARFAAAPMSFDLVVSDLAMPGMDGEELIGHLAGIRPGLPIVVVSGYVESARQRILESGHARAVMRKPVSRDELGRTLAQALRAAP